MSPATVPTKPFPWYYRPVEWLLLGLARLPWPVLYGLANVIYGLLAYVLRYRRRVILTNLRNSFPEKTEAEIQRLSHTFYRHFSQVMVEILKLAVMPPAELLSRVQFRNAELLDRWLAEGRLVLALGSHAGNWEWILTSGALRLRQGAVDGVYKPLMNPFFEHFLLRLRTRTGAHLVPMRETLRHMVQHRHEARVLSLLSDQAAGPEDKPHWTTFLHQETSFYTGADRLAAQFNCPVAYVNIRRLRRGYYELVVAELHDGQTPLNKNATVITEAFARHLERDIQSAPADYLWSHRRWKHKRDLRQ
ncbi:lysophospholipid acyltransferase family protein [Hymenobacter weizhouensis]|uniref:lysophospholipid acyltransferase family protein n=1 Tax=Hymenobacter sp. YIM 151500-1 TaxID=2987689 RepID=UPI0022269F96|nr:lauroyl acyltransferase [Hymenobacter sp. YIM 151500-1]UYZ65111.1 lauroyl acyltransferase [Hymenobacter sp. YIM 151500-1]